jgi:CBS domain containing-hemolysin-like protein
VPESKPIGDLFAEMREKQVQMAVVLDEYGGTAGIVTAEELVEEIVGRMSDEWVAEPEVVRIDEETADIDALMRVDEVNEELGLNLPENENYETVAGFLLYRLGRIPEEGERYRYGDLVLTVTKREGPKIARVQVHRLKAKGSAAGA